MVRVELIRSMGVVAQHATCAAAMEWWANVLINMIDGTDVEALNRRAVVCRESIIRALARSAAHATSPQAERWWMSTAVWMVRGEDEDVRRGREWIVKAVGLVSIVREIRDCGCRAG